MMRKIGVDRKHVGVWSEMIACAWLISEGYDVYKNVSFYGMTDIVIHKNGEFKKIDVKTVSVAKRKDGGTYATLSKLTEDQIVDGVVPFYVVPDGYCTFSAEDADSYVFQYWEFEE